MQHALLFLVIALIRYLHRKGTLDMNDFIDSSLRFLEEPELDMSKQDRKELMKIIVGLPRKAD